MARILTVALLVSLLMNPFCLCGGLLSLGGHGFAAWHNPGNPCASAACHPQHHEHHCEHLPLTASATCHDDHPGHCHPMTDHQDCPCLANHAHAWHGILTNHASCPLGPQLTGVTDHPVHGKLPRRVRLSARAGKLPPVTNGPNRLLQVYCVLRA